MREYLVRVHSNPFAFVDHKGRPAGAVRTVAQPGDTVHGFVGAEMVVDVLRTETRGAGGQSYTEVTAQDTHFEFSPDPVVLWKDWRNPLAVTEFRHYADAIRHGALIPADEATAKLFGLKFVPREEALQTAKDAALAKLKAHLNEEDGDELPELEVNEIGTRAAKLRAASDRRRRIAQGLPPEDVAPPAATPAAEATAPPAAVQVAGVLPPSTKPGLVALSEPQPSKLSTLEVSK